MENFNSVLLLDSMGLVQGVLLGLMLIIIHSRKRKAVVYLGLFIILFSLEPLENIFNELGILKKMPHLILMPVSFHFLAYPLFYIYLQKISILENEKPSYWTLIPGMAEFLVGIAVFLLPLHIKTWIKDSNAMLIYFLLGMSYSLFIQFLSLKWIARHRREVEKQYSLLLHRNLKWSSYFVYASILFSILFLFMFITDNTLVYIFYSVINVILIYWISYQGFAQQNIAPLFTDLHMVQSEVYEIKKDKDVVGPAKNEALDVSEETNKPNSHEIEVYRNVVAKLQEHVVSSKCFTKEDLTIIDVSEAIKIHPRRISQSIIV